jgi:hypothetical protein
MDDVEWEGGDDAEAKTRDEAEVERGASEADEDAANEADDEQADGVTVTVEAPAVEEPSAKKKVDQMDRSSY